MKVHAVAHLTADVAEFVPIMLVPSSFIAKA